MAPSQWLSPEDIQKAVTHQPEKPTVSTSPLRGWVSPWRSPGSHTSTAPLQVQVLSLLLELGVRDNVQFAKELGAREKVQHATSFLGLAAHHLALPVVCNHLSQLSWALGIQLPPSAVLQAAKVQSLDSQSWRGSLPLPTVIGIFPGVMLLFQHESSYIFVHPLNFFHAKSVFSPKYNCSNSVYNKNKGFLWYQG